MARYRAYLLVAIGVLLIIMGLFESDSADWAQIVQIVAGVILLAEGTMTLGRESREPRR